MAYIEEYELAEKEAAPGIREDDAPGVWGGISLALYDTLRDPGRVIACRGPAVYMRPGEVLHLPEAEAVEAWQSAAEETPLVTTVDEGVCLLSKRYATMTGIGLCLTFHGKTASMARCVGAGALRGPHLLGTYDVTPRLLAYGAPTRADEATCRALTEVSARLREMDERFPRLNRESEVAWGEVAQWIDALARLVGCDMELEMPEDGILASDYVRTYEMRLWEAWLTAGLCLARAYSAERKLVCRLGCETAQEGGRTCRYLSVSVACELLTSTRARLMDRHTRKRKEPACVPGVSQALEGLACLEALLGARQVVTSHRLGEEYVAPADPHCLCRGFYARMAVLQDPATLPDGDIKAEVRFGPGT